VENLQQDHQEDLRGLLEDLLENLQRDHQEDLRGLLDLEDLKKGRQEGQPDLLDDIVPGHLMDTPEDPETLPHEEDTPDLRQEDIALDQPRGHQSDLMSQSRDQSRRTVVLQIRQFLRLCFIRLNAFSPKMKPKIDDTLAQGLRMIVQKL